MNVRFFSGTRAQYDSLPSPRNPLGLYFCEDTRELFWADRLLTDGIRVVQTFADLPTRADAIADGVVYYVTETRNGYVISPDRTQWLQTIYAPVTNAYAVPESEYYNTVTTVGAVRDIEAKIYGAINELDDRIADLEVGITAAGVKAIYFAGQKLYAHDDGTYHIDRLCALRALGFSIPEDLNEELELITKEYIDNQFSEVLAKYYTKSEIDALIPDTSKFITAEELPELPTKVSELENDAGYLTEHQSLDGYATEEFVAEAISDVATDLSNYYTKDETAEVISEAVAEKADSIVFTTDQFVGKPVGNFVLGENVKGLTIAEILAKLLELTDTAGENPPEEPTSIVDKIIYKQIPMYSTDATGSISEVPYVLITGNEFEMSQEPTQSCFYQIVNDAGEVVESGYQQLAIENEDAYFVIALPNEVDYNTMVTVKAYEGAFTHSWQVVEKLEMISDRATVEQLCEEVGMDISQVPDTHTVWLYQDVSTGTKYRFVINE